MLKKRCPKLRAVVSFADPGEGHYGGIYQAGGWVYVGQSKQASFFHLSDGRVVHSRAVQNHWGRRSLARRLITGKTEIRPGKYKYLYPLDVEIRERIQPMALPYPKRAGSIAVDASAFQAEEGGSSPTPALHTSAIDQEATLDATGQTFAEVEAQR